MSRLGSARPGGTNRGYGERGVGPGLYPHLIRSILVRVLLYRFCDVGRGVVACLEARNGAPKTQYCAATGGGLAQILLKLKDSSFGHD